MTQRLSGDSHGLLSQSNGCEFLNDSLIVVVNHVVMK